MDKPVLVIMAAGMGSRYGGLKQIDPVDEYGNKIIDFSIFDAKRAGFEKVIFVIKRENEAMFREAIGDRFSSLIEVEYAFQELEDLPEGISVPEGRIKPYGTGHAVLSCRNLISGPFVVINSDDFYGAKAFKVVFDHLTCGSNGCENADEIGNEPKEGSYCMVGFKLDNTLTDNGYVSRGICTADENGYLTDIVERTNIIRTAEGAAYSENGTDYVPISADSITSMNMWGFSADFMDRLKEAFDYFCNNGLKNNPLKGEFYIPFVVDELLKSGRATVKVLSSDDKWFGVTYKEDKPFVTESIRALKNAGVYPERLWD